MKPWARENGGRVRTAVAALGLLAGAAAVGHAGPALAAVGPLRRHLTPALAGVGDPRHVALTFDGGPHPETTPRLIEVLDKARVRATFFLLGRAVEENPAIAARLADAGHEIAVQGYDNRILLGRSPGAAGRDLLRATRAVAGTTGEIPAWWRPPHGIATGPGIVAAHLLGLTPVLWTRSCTPDAVFQTVWRGLAGGGTVLLRDTAAVPAVVSLCRTRGLAVGPLAEHGLETSTGTLPGRSHSPTVRGSAGRN
jgi:peptidoglycan/xylan/chitin deacetylase (PgdA/CDA1 family)